MTTADTARAVGRSLSPPRERQRQPKSIDMRTPLPDGWHYFCSAPSRDIPATWYATPPHETMARLRALGVHTADLQQTVTGTTWVELHAAVAEQEGIYREYGA